jgi:hypothetical protein
MRLAPQTSGVNRRARSRLGRESIAPIGIVGLSAFAAALARERVRRTATSCQILCEQQYQTCDITCSEFYQGDPAGYFDCRHGCIIAYDMCLAICELMEGPF